MAIIIPDHLPSRWILESEGIFVMSRDSAAGQEIRPLRIALVQPAACSSEDELALAALLAQTPLQVEITVVGFGVGTDLDGRGPLPGRRAFHAIQQDYFDGVVVASAPFDHLDWHQAPCWDEYRDFLDWSETATRARLFLGWSAQGALHHVYGVPRRPLERFQTGLFPHRLVRRNSFLMRGFDDLFDAPLQRHAEVSRDDLLDAPGLQILADGLDTGAYLVRNANRRDVFVLGRPEAGRTGEAEQEHAATARSHAHLLFANWLNYYVYQVFSHHPDHAV